MKGKTRSFITVLAALFLADTLIKEALINEVFGCVPTVPVDEVELPPGVTTLAPGETTIGTTAATTEVTTAPVTTTKSGPTTTVFTCPSCGTLCTTVNLCNMLPEDWDQIGSPGALNSPNVCASFPGHTNPADARPFATVGGLVCTAGPPGFPKACFRGTWQGHSGLWQVYSGGTMVISGFCESPTDCATILANVAGAGSPFVITSEDDPTLTYVFPPNGTPYKTDGSVNLVMTDVCCGSCSVCESLGCVNEGDG